jgi:uncharacterized membrane protein
LLVLIAGFLLKNGTVKNTGLGLLVVAALVAIPAFLTGEPAEEILESAGLANDQFIETHEETAEWALWVCEISGVLALAALFASYKRMNIARTLTIIATIVALMSSLAWIKVGSTGGEIRHTEIRSGNVQQNNNNEKDDD